MDNSDIILQMPFDESAGATVTYDYSASRADGAVYGATFVQGKNGNAVSFPGDGYVDVLLKTIDMNSDFTLTFWAKAGTIDCGSPTQMIWILTFVDASTGDDDGYIEFPFDTKADTWYYCALVRNGNNFSFYVNNECKTTIAHGGSLSGIALNQDCYSVEYGLGCLDDFTIYQEALTQSEISALATGSKTVKYTIDGIDFKTWNVFVSTSKGVVDRPTIKTPASLDWDDYHGESVDLNHIYYKPREITLGCFITADSKENFIHQVREFEQQFDGKGLHRLVIDVHPTKPLIYLVYVKDSIEITKTWSDDTMVGTFNLKLIEPEPVKMILKHYTSSNLTATFNCTSSKYLNIFWGDGTADYDVCGALNQAMSISHTYAEAGEYYIVITGCIDEIENYKTDDIVVWAKI